MTPAKADGFIDNDDHVVQPKRSVKKPTIQEACAARLVKAKVHDYVTFDEEDVDG